MKNQLNFLIIEYNHIFSITNILFDRFLINGILPIILYVGIKTSIPFVFIGKGKIIV